METLMCISCIKKQDAKNIGQYEVTARCSVCNEVKGCKDVF